MGQVDGCTLTLQSLISITLRADSIDRKTYVHVIREKKKTFVHMPKIITGVDLAQW